MCSPHCWQYANPTGVGVPQRGHDTVDGRPARGGDASGPRGAKPGPPAPVPTPICGGAPIGCATGGAINGPDGAAIGDGVANGPAGGATIGAPSGGANAGEPGVVCSAAPQLRQNFIPGGFSPRHDPQMIAGNPPLGAGVCVGGGASALPQFRQNDDPGGLWWPQDEQRSID
jgi:hypothetical protein